MNPSDRQLQTAQQLLQDRRLPEALALLDTILARRPNDLEAHLKRGSALFRMGRLDAALASVDRAIALEPRHPGAHLLKGSICGAGGRYDMALAAYDRAIAIRPEFADAWFGRGNALARKNSHADALASYRQTLALAPNHADAWVGCAEALVNTGRGDEALEAYGKALAIRPEQTNALLGRANLLLNLRRFDEARPDYDRLLRLNPNLAAAWLGRGIIEGRAQRRDDALNAFQRALALDPGLARAWLQGGIVLREMGRNAEAFDAVRKALDLDPGLEDGWVELGALELKGRNYPAALAAYARARELHPGLPGVDGTCFRIKTLTFDWTDFDAEREALLASFRAGVPVLPPFLFVAVFDGPEDQLHCARMWAWPADPQPAWQGERYDHERLRIAYLSADFHEHPVAVQIAGMIEHHDRSRFEVTAISVGSKDDSDMRKRLQAGFDRFVDAAAMSDREVADLARKLEIDILVDLSGATEGGRPRVLAKRCAPIQVNYLGYPGTMGTDYHDYILADRIVIPEHHRRHYSEKVVHLPDSYMVTDDTREISETRFTRAELGLPAEAIVYCCFNNNYKISPAMFDIWMRILARVEGSVLWLHQRAAPAADALRREAAARGIAPERLIFADRMPRLADHLARHRAADLFLDTIPFNAHSTAVDALWAGLPVVTRLGESFAGRVAASLLHAVGLPELIATTADDYERLAVELGSDGAKLQALKQRLADNRLTAPLFATARFTRAVEDAFVEMHQRHRAGLPPDHLVAPR